MSTSQLQAALVSLVRYPELNRAEKLEDFLSKYELSEKEQWQVRSLASSYYVSKFGRDQRATRFDLSVLGTIPLSVKVAGRKKMARDIYGIRFECFNEGLPVSDLGKKFAAFFIENAESLAKELDLPPFIGDLARYEFTEYYMKGPEAPKDWNVGPTSLLRPDVPLRVEAFGYDMVTFVEGARKVEEAELPKLSPEKRETIVLFARVPQGSEGGFVFKQFEIDPSLRDFLKGQSLETPPSAPDLPPCYADLVSLDLCRPLA